MRRWLTLAVALPLAGCAYVTDVTNKAESLFTTSKPPYPQSIYVYDFAVSPGEVPSGAAAAEQLAGAVDDPNSNAKRAVLERKIADTLSGKLVSALQEAGLPAVRWTGTLPKNKDAYILEGQFLTTDGNGQKVVGLTLGGTKLRVLAQLYHLDDGEKQLFHKVTVGRHGLAGDLPATKLSAGKAASSVSTAVGAVQDTNSKVRAGAEETATTIVNLMKPKMREQGWF